MSRQNEHTYVVPGMSCDHCKAAVTAQLEQLRGVEDVAIDLQTKQVTVRAAPLDDGAVRRAIADAGYDVAA
jgi:copper chaperone